MSAGPVLALRTAILAALAADPALADLFRREPAPARRAAAGARCRSTRCSDARSRATRRARGVRAHAQEADIVVWSRPGSAATGLAVADRMAALLDDADLTLPGHRLVRLRVAESGATREPASGASRAWLKLTALTEALD